MIRRFLGSIDKMTAAGFEKNQRQVSLGDTHQAMPVSLDCCSTAHSNQGEISSPFQTKGLKNKTISRILRKIASADWLRRLPLYFWGLTNIRTTTPTKSRLSPLSKEIVIILRFLLRFQGSIALKCQQEEGVGGKVMKLHSFIVQMQLETFFRMLSISLSGKCLSGNNVSVCWNKPK